MSPSPFVIPFFIAHQGCPHRCVFCNQHAITGCGEKELLSGEKVAAETMRRLALPRDRRREVQVAFYGGSFTALARSRQEELLGAVAPFLATGEVADIRLSTRPDAMDGDTARFLKRHGVALVELGIQSFEPEVLAASRRGHSPEQVDQAFAALRAAGIAPGGQLMIGLPGESRMGVLAGARRLVRLRPALVRIYPTLVLKKSPLARLFAEGKYHPLSLSRAVALTCRLKNVFDAAGIPVVRMGLQPSAGLEEELLAGPYHPAFGELVLGRLYYLKLRSLLFGLQKRRGDGTIRLILSAADRSLFSGQRRCSANRLEALGLLAGVETVFQTGQPRFTMREET